MRRQGILEDESGITVVELTIVMILMFVVFAIASSVWLSAVEARRVDSATNQLAADLRRAHTRAINRLADQTVTLTAGNSEYTLPGGVATDLDESPDQDVVYVTGNYQVVFKGDGSAQVTGANPTTVRGTTPPPPVDNGRKHTIVINPVTSAVQIGP